MRQVRLFFQVIACGAALCPMIWILSCFPTPQNQPSVAEVMVVHKRACVAKGEVLISKSQMENLPCHTIELKLRVFVERDEDCQAYYGDAGVTIGLCEPTDGGAG